MDKDVLLLVLTMAELWARHMQGFADDDADVAEDLEAFNEMRMAVHDILDKQLATETETATMPERIEAMIVELEPDAMPVQIALFSEKPLQYLLAAQGHRISADTYDALNHAFPDMIVLF